MSATDEQPPGGFGCLPALALGLAAWLVLGCIVAWVDSYVGAG